MMRLNPLKQNFSLYIKVQEDKGYGSKYKQTLIGDFN